MRQILIASMAPVLWILTVFDVFAVWKMFDQYSKKKKIISQLIGVIANNLH